MKIATPAPGTLLVDVDTPALILDLDAFDQNIAIMAAAVAKTPGVRLRPHAKAHKCPEIARRQIAAGAVGVCCQTVSEAEAMAAGGITDILVSNVVVSPPKIERLARLADKVHVSVLVDNAANVTALETAARKAGTTLDVLVEVEAGSLRCGVTPGEPAVALAKQVAACKHLRFVGIQAYHGKAQHRRTVEERRRSVEYATDRARTTRDLLQAAGLECKVVAGAGTGTFIFEQASGVYTELEPGSYVFMDADYGQNNWDGFPQFQQSLFIWTTVISTPEPERVVVDAGIKAHSFDSGMPLVVGYPSVKYTCESDEHGVLEVGPGAEAPAYGSKLRLIPGHCDPTVALYDQLICVRGDRVEAVWPISAHGY